MRKAEARARIVKGNRQESQRVLDPWAKEYESGEVLTPPIQFHELSEIIEQSNILPQCIEAMAENVVGFGYDLEIIVPEEEREPFEKAIAKERERVETFFDYCSYEEPFTTLRKNTRRDYEGFGNAWWEILRDNEERMDGFRRLPSRTMRLGKKVTRLEVRAWRLKAHEWEYDNSSRYFRDFRLHVQMVGTKKVWFKELGDPRDIDARTGKEITEEYVREAERTGEKIIKATEVVHFRHEGWSSPYGIPRWIGNMVSAAGSRACEELNWSTFEKRGLGRCVVLFSGATMSEEGFTRMKEYIEKAARGKRRNENDVLVLEAVGEQKGPTDQTTTPAKVEIKELGTIAEALYRDYDKDNRLKLRSSFRLPPLYVGESQDYSRATAKESKEVAEEQVFKPARRDEDFFFTRMIFPELKVIYHSFVTRSSIVENQADFVEMWERAGNAGMPLRYVIEQLSRVLHVDVDMDALDDKWLDIPIKLASVLLRKSTGGAFGNPEDEEEPEEEPGDEPGGEEEKALQGAAHKVIYALKGLRDAARRKREGAA